MCHKRSVHLPLITGCGSVWGATRALPVADAARGASGRGLWATQARRRQGAHRAPQQEGRRHTSHASFHSYYNRMWLSLVERLLWEQDAAGSNPVIRTKKQSIPCGVLCFCYKCVSRHPMNNASCSWGALSPDGLNRYFW